MSNEVIERVALAICNADNSQEVDAKHYLVLARAAIEALMEPSKEMINAGIIAAEEVEDWTADSYERYRVDSASDMPRPVFQAMIHAALT